MFASIDPAAFTRIGRRDASLAGGAAGARRRRVPRLKRRIAAPVGSVSSGRADLSWRPAPVAGRMRPISALLLDGDHGRACAEARSGSALPRPQASARANEAGRGSISAPLEPSARADLAERSGVVSFQGEEAAAVPSPDSETAEALCVGKIAVIAMATCHAHRRADGAATNPGARPP
jgi:hypothetical protein